MSVGTLNVFCLDATAESSYGTAATTPDKRWPFRGNKPKINVTAVTDEDSWVGVMEQGLSSIPAKKWAEGSFEYDLRLDALALWLKYALGALATSGTNPYTHTCTVNQGDAPSFTGFWKDANTTASKLEQFTGLKVRRLTIRGSAGGKLTLGVELMGSGVHTEVTATAPAQNTDAILPFSSISAFTVGGTDYKSKLLDFELVIENQFDDNSEFVAGSLTLPALERTGIAVSGRFTVKHDENSLAGLTASVEAQTSQAIVLTVTSGTTSATFNVYNAVLDDTSTDGGRSKLKKPISFKGLYSAANTAAVQAVVTNTTASYT